MMVRRVHVHARVRHPVVKVFAYLEDPTRWKEFAPAAAVRRQLDPGPARVGTRWAAEDHVGPFRIRFTDLLAVHEQDRRLVWHSSHPWNAEVEYVCVPDGMSTRVHARYEGELGGWLRVLGLIVPDRIAAWILSQDFRRMGARLDAAAKREAMALASSSGSVPRGSGDRREISIGQAR